MFNFYMKYFLMKIKINYLIQKWIKTWMIKTWMIIHSLSCTLYTTLIFQIFTYGTNVGQWGIHHSSPLGEYLFLIVPCHLWFFLLYGISVYPGSINGVSTWRYPDHGSTFGSVYDRQGLVGCPYGSHIPRRLTCA